MTSIFRASFIFVFACFIFHIPFVEVKADDSAENLVGKVINDVLEFSQGQDIQDDDITLVAIKTT